MNETKWISKTEYVDIETGEVINNKEVKNYIIINKKKHVKFENNAGTITWTNECRKSKQGRLF